MSLLIGTTLMNPIKISLALFNLRNLTWLEVAAAFQAILFQVQMPTTL